MGATGVHTHTFAPDRKPECPVCGSQQKTITVGATSSLQGLIDILTGEEHGFRLSKPSLSTSEKTLYMSTGPLKAALAGNLLLPLNTLMESGDEVAVTDPVFPGDVSLGLTVVFA